MPSYPSACGSLTLRCVERVGKEKKISYMYTYMYKAGKGDKGDWHTLK